MKKTLWILTLVLVVALGAFFVSAEEALPSTCPHCQQAVTWEPLAEEAAEEGAIAAGHYYLAFEADSADWAKKSIPGKVCLFMNGKTVTSTADRLFAVSGELSLIGEGSAVGRGFTNTTSYGGAINITGKVNLYGATVTTTGEEGRTAGRGGVIYVNDGELNIYSGTVTGGRAANGATVGIDDAVVNVYGGTIQGGTATAAGGAVYIRTNGTLNVAGGTVQGGTAKTTGGAVHVHENATLKMSAGAITGGEATSNGGTVYYRGGSSEITGGTIGGGKAGNAGGSLYIYKGTTFSMAGGQITDGHADTSETGTCVWVAETANITLSGSASITELRFPVYSRDALTVKGVCTGTVSFRGKTGEVDDGIVIGASENADLHKASYGVANTEYYVIHKGDDIVVSNLGYIDPVTTKTGYCEACGKHVEWMAYTANEYEIDTYIYSGHYYVESESTACDWKQKFVVGNDCVCLDLNGKQLVGRSRAFNVTKGTLNIMDTAGGGEITGTGPIGVNTVYGGTLFVREDGAVNLYSGKLTYSLPTDGRAIVTRGGVAYICGVFNIYGGEVSGGAARAGANLYADADSAYVGHIGLYGGTVGGNVAVPGYSTSGPCIATRGTVTLSGAPVVNELLLTANDYTPADGERITAEGTFTGNVTLNFGTFASGMDIGNAKAAQLSGGDITITDDKTAYVLVWKDQLLAVSGTPAALLIKADGIAGAYGTLSEAVEACTEADKVVLLSDAQDLAVNKLIHLDLNGFDITGNVTGTGVLACMDSCTDDFTVADGDYGRITGTVTCTLTGVSAEAACSADNYLMIKESDGVSFHCVRLAITGSVLRPSCAGIYYRSAFYGDEKVAALVDTLGVALNAYEVPNADNMLTTSLYTRLGAAQFNMPGTSCLLSGVMKTDNTDAQNLTNAATSVYANAYVKLTDGTVLFGEAKSTNLQEQAAAIDTDWIDLTLTQKRAFVAMFEAFDAVMRDSTWSVSNALSIVDRKLLFSTTDYTSYLAPWTHDVVAEAKADGKIHYYFMAGEGLHISDAQTYKDKWGDSCLVVFPNGQTLLIDVGPLAYAPVIAKNLERMGITHLDALLITHPHNDHHGGAFADAAVMGIGLLENITVDKVYYRGGYDLTSDAATLVARTCTDLGIPYAVMDKGDVLNFGDVRMECIWPLAGEGDAQISGGEEVNNMSIVTRFDYGEHSSLFTGDLYLQGEKWILERVDQSLLDVDFLKVPHHGYATSSSVDFIEAVSPEVAMATGRLPIPSKIRERYESLGVTFLDDRTNGYVEVTGAADGTLEYVVSRGDSTTGDVSEATPDTGEVDE